MEINAFTLEEIARLDSAWINRARALFAAGRLELIGSGYSQMIGPLVPARVVAENLRIGNEIYSELLGARPVIALVNEQAYSAGLVGHYLDAGYEALLMEWDNPASQHPEWAPELQYLPQYAQGADGRKIALLWTNTTAFQQLQRYAHGDMTLQRYQRFVRDRRSLSTRALCLYASDAEIFDFRPGRFRTEEALSGESEWRKLDRALRGVTSETGINLIGPSHVLKLINRDGGGTTMRLESSTCPVPVKKQRKYNLSRWAVTGRDNTAINAACERIYRGLLEAENVGDPVQSADWKELCYLWASDFRTHLTQARWAGLCKRLEAAEHRWGAAALPSPVSAPEDCPPITARYVNIETGNVFARLDRRRGLAIEYMRFADETHAVLGRLGHGYFADINLQADWYTGNSVFEAPGEHKVTDLEWCEPRKWTERSGDCLVQASVETPNGPIHKTIRFLAARPRAEFDLLFDWKEWGKGVLRLGHITLLPDAFDVDRLILATTNGGAREEFALGGQPVDHGAPVSFLVSSSFGFGMTEGWAELGDSKTRIRIEVDRSTAPLLGLLTYKRAGSSAFCQLMLSALELDETRKPAAYAPGPRRFRFAIEAV